MLVDAVIAEILTHGMKKDSVQITKGIKLQVKQF
jgi:hypothetical protein